MSEIEPFPGEDASELGMAARKEWPVILWFSSTKSDKMVASHMFSLAFVRSFPERKANTGLVGSKIPTFSAISFSTLRAAEGQEVVHRGAGCGALALQG